jgi:D-threo-aldose 1-dehydrogenase
LVLPDLPRDAFVLSTKVGRRREIDGEGRRRDHFDYSRESVLRSLDESLERLQLDRVDIALIHDPDDHYEDAMNGAYPALAELRSQGVVKAIGAGMNQWQMLTRLARDGDFDCFLLAGRYTLLDQSGLAELLPLCVEKRISIILGGPYNSGILASDLSPGATFDYNLVSTDMLGRARRAKSVCDRHEVPLKAAALQFGLAHPAVAATIPGARSTAEVEENIRMAAHPIPDALWDGLRGEGLVSAGAPTP